MQSTAIKLQPGTKEWHDNRKLGIGGSDAAAALGMSKWKTPFQLYQEKLGLAEPEEESWPMAQGKAIEPLLRQYYANETGREVALPVDVMVSENYPFMRYNPDGLSMVDRRLQEFKTAAFGQGWGETGTDEIPQEYILQVQHGMIVTGFDVTDVTVSIAGNKPKYFIVEADKELQEMLIEGEAAFWEKVKNEIAPDPIDNQDCSRIFTKVNGQSITADEAVKEAIITLKHFRAQIKDGEARKETIEVFIKSFMQENETLVDEFGVPLITWKQQKGARRIDADALRDNFPEIAEQVTTIGSPVRKFLVK